MGFLTQHPHPVPQNSQLRSGRILPTTLCSCWGEQESKRRRNPALSDLPDKPWRGARVQDCPAGVGAAPPVWGQLLCGQDSSSQGLAAEAGTLKFRCTHFSTGIERWGLEFPHGAGTGTRFLSSVRPFLGWLEMVAPFCGK